MFEIFAAWRELLHVSEWTGLSVGALGLLAAGAYFLPEMRALAIRAAIVTAAAYGGLLYGNHTGRADVKAQWDAATIKAAAAKDAADADAQNALDAKYLPVIAALQKQAADLQRQADGDDSKTVGIVAGACQLGSAPLRLRGKPK